MKSYFCAQHDLVAATIQAGHWPAAADPALRAHVESCPSCSDLVLVAQTLRQSRTESAQSARLASPGILWWRAQVRRRNSALQSVARPVAVAEGVALLILLVAVIALAAWQHDQVAAWLGTVFGPLSNIAQIPGALMVGLGTLLVFGGFAVYLLLAKE